MPVEIHDTVRVEVPTYIEVPVEVHDTIEVSYPVYVHDTIYIYDTLVTSSNQVESISAKIYGNNGQIIVEGANGKGVTLYSASGQLVATKQDDYSEVCFDAPASGVYLVKIGDFAPRKIVIKK